MWLCAIKKLLTHPMLPVPRKLGSSPTAWKLAKLLSDVDRSSPVLTRPSALRSSNQLRNASAKNEGAVCQFSPIRIAKNHWLP